MLQISACLFSLYRTTRPVNPHATLNGRSPARAGKIQVLTRCLMKLNHRSFSLVRIISLALLEYGRYDYSNPTDRLSSGSVSPNKPYWDDPEYMQSKTFWDRSYSQEGAPPNRSPGYSTRPDTLPSLKSTLGSSHLSISPTLTPHRLVPRRSTSYDSLKQRKTPSPPPEIPRPSHLPPELARLAITRPIGGATMKRQSILPRVEPMGDGPSREIQGRRASSEEVEKSSERGAIPRLCRVSDPCSDTDQDASKQRPVRTLRL